MNLSNGALKEAAEASTGGPVATVTAAKTPDHAVMLIDLVLIEPEGVPSSAVRFSVITHGQRLSCFMTVKLFAQMVDGYVVGVLPGEKRAQAAVR
jgi:hypothetical protein